MRGAKPEDGESFLPQPLTLHAVAEFQTFPSSHPSSCRGSLR
jgi:hypothetical protein